MVAYLATMSGQIGFEDAGLFSTVCYFNGIPHPPGYPLYSLLCPPFAHIPGFSAAHGVALFSALCATFSCIVLAVICAKITGNLTVSIGAGLVYGFSLSFWSQAIIQEIYTLHTLIFFSGIYLCLSFVSPNHLSLKTWFAFCITIGLGLSNHWPLFVLSGLIFPCLLLTRAKAVITWLWWKPLVTGGGGLLIGLLPYAFLWMRSRSNPFINFYDPFNNLSDFLFFINRSGYASVDNAGGSWEDKKAFLLWLSQSLGEQITWVWALLALVALIKQVKTQPMLLIGVLTAVLGCSIALILALDFQFNDQSRAVFHVYPLVAWGGMALLGGIGLHHLTAPLKARTQSMINLGAVGFCVLTLVSMNGHANYRPSETFADQLAKAVLDSLEPNAIFISYADFSLPILYKHLVERYRPDVTLYNSQALILNNRLTPAVAPVKQKQQAYASFIASTKRPVYYFLCEGCPFGHEDYGLLKKAKPDFTQGKVHRKTLPHLLSLLNTSTKEGHSDKWSSALKQRFTHSQARLLYQLSKHHPDHNALWKALINSPSGRIALANEWINNPREAEYYEPILMGLQQDIKNQTTAPPFQQTSFYSALGKLKALNPSTPMINRAFATFDQGINIYPFFDNPSLLAAFELALQLNDTERSKTLLKKYPKLASISNVYQKQQNNRQIDALLNTIRPLLQTKTLNSTLTQNIQHLQQLEPGSARTLFLTGTYHALSSDFDQALPLFLSVLKQKPDHFGALLNTIQIYAVKQQWLELKTLLERAQQIAPQNPIVQNITQQLQQTPWSIEEHVSPPFK